MPNRPSSQIYSLRSSSEHKRQHHRVLFLLIKSTISKDIDFDEMEKWSFDLDSQVISSPIINGDGIIYVGSNDHGVYAIHPNGTQKWAFQTGDMVISSPAIGVDGTVYVGSYDGKLYAIHPDGTQKWLFVPDTAR